MMSRRGTSSGGGASSLGYLFGSDATTLARPNNRAPPRQPSTDIAISNSNRDNNRDSNRSNNRDSFSREFAGLSDSKHQGFEHDARDTETPPPPGSQTPSGYHTPLGSNGDGGHRYNRSPEAAGKATRTYLPQTRAAGKVVNDGGGVSLDMSGGNFMGGNNNYFRADGQNSGNFITGRPSTRVQAAPGGCSSLGYLFGGA